jgi:NAD(P)-dependent dehydrogenase (short-subunit alcohol dehydrogenase family)
MESDVADAHSLFDLAGRTAIVTGGGGALGSVVSEGLAAAGARVAVVDLRQENAERVSAAIVASGGQAVGIGADLSSEAEVEGMFAAVDKELGGVDVLVNAVSAAVDRFPAEQFPVAEWNHMLTANLTSYFMCSKAAAIRMIASARGGSIVNFSSIAGVSALGRGNLAYSTAKAAVGQMTREHAYAWARHGIRVNAVLPCQFVNDWWAGQIADPAHGPLVDRALSAIPLGRLGEPREIVGPVLFLASDAASMVTGIMLPVDGGNLAMNAGASIDW